MNVFQMNKKVGVIFCILLGLAFLAFGVSTGAAQTFRWQAQDENPSEYPTFKTLEIMCEKIKQISDGKLTIRPHPGGAIVTADTELRSVHQGLLDMSSTEATNVAGTFPTAPLFTKTVGGVTAMEQYFWYRVGPGLDLLSEMFERKNWNVKPIAVVAVPAETFLYSNKKLEKPEDLKGMKIRLLGDEAKIFGKLGVAATSTSSEELYGAMQRGVVDAFQHANLADDLPLGFNEICNYAYISPVRQPSASFIISVNKDSWAELPENLKTLVEEVCWSQGINYYAKSTSKIGEASSTWEESGVKIQPIPKSIEEALQKAADEFYQEQIEGRPFYKKVYQSIQEWKEMYRAAFQRL